MNSTFTGNTGSYGGALYAANTRGLVIRGSIFTNNAEGNGGGIFLYMHDGALVLQNNTVSGNSSTNGSAGGIYIAESADKNRIQNSTNTLNIAANGWGGGIFVDAMAIVFISKAR